VTTGDRTLSHVGRRLLRRRISLAEALVAAVSMTAGAVLTAAAAVTRTDPEQFPAPPAVSSRRREDG